MQLTLSIRTGNGVPQNDGKPKSFNSFPIIIGRSTSCHFVLTDQSRYISSNHAVVSEDNGMFFLEDTSANGVYVNGSNDPIGRGKVTQLYDGDSIAIGNYSLEARISTNAVDTEDPFAFVENAPPQSKPHNPFEDAELDWTPKSEQKQSDKWASNSNQSQTDGNWANWSALNDNDNNKHAEPPIEQRNSPSLEPDPWFDIPDKKDKSVNQNSVAPHEIVTKPNHEQVPIQNRPTPEPRPVVRRRTPAPANTPQQSEAELNAQKAIQAFFSAAQLQQKNFSDQSPEALMTQTGKLLNLAIDGMMMLLQSRAEIKNAIRSDVTQLNRIDNNPLKFSYSAQDALTKLLSEDQGGGYLDSDRAMAQAIEDLKIHQVALLEGMKAAVKALLLDFNPDKLADALEIKHPIAANIPITREAKLWQLYQEHYSDIKEDAVNNFGEMFGVEFRKAYEQRIKDINKH